MAKCKALAESVVKGLRELLKYKLTIHHFMLYITWAISYLFPAPCPRIMIELA